MNINDFLQKDGEWFKGTGPRSDIVISSRVRLARNLLGHRFFNNTDDEEAIKILEEIFDGFKSIEALKNTTLFRMKDMPELDREFLVERHLMSIEHMENQINAKALFVDDNEVLSIMVNEEDHLRIQILQSGFNLEEAWNMVNGIDDAIAVKLKYAFRSDLGFLTACPTNTGTGLRGSVMIHLPALMLTNQIGKVFEAISKLGLTMRGLYGEGTEATGDFFQISNQVTLGVSEADLIENIKRIINKLILRETATREMLMSKNKSQIEDNIWRALGTLKSARVITSSETISLLSLIRLGINLGIIKGIDLKSINELFILMQPAHLQKIEGNTLKAIERDRKRAELIREKVKNIEE